MALIGARGLVFVTCFLVIAGIIEYLIISHMYSGSVRVQFSDWDNPRIKDGFSKVDVWEVENVEAKYKKIKFIPPGHNEKDNWKESRSKLLKNWAGIDSPPKKENLNDARVNIQPPPPPRPDGNFQEDSDKLDANNDRNNRNPSNVDQFVGGVEGGRKSDRELPVQKRAIDKKEEDYDFDDYEVNEHGKRKDLKENKEIDSDHDQKGDKLESKSELALASLDNFKKQLSNTLTPNKDVKEGGDNEKKEDNPIIIKENSMEIFDDGQQNSPFYNGRAQVGELLVETNLNLHPRPLTPFEAVGDDIMFTVRTTKPFHDKRLPLLFETWMTRANHSNIFIVTDGEDKKWLKKCWDEDMHYILTSCGKTYLRNELCCKAGIELALVFKEGSEHFNWLCHVDDDIYVNVKQLVTFLSKFHPKKEAVYFGRSGSGWKTPRTVMEGAQYGKPGQTYHFAVGGMYCLSRHMLELAKPYLVGGKNFAQSCAQTLEPEDVTVGVVVGVMLNKELSRTEAIYTHGLHLGSMVDPYTLDKQIAFAYGYGAVKWGYDPYNAIYVPNGLFSLTEDESQFRSLHCHLYPDEEMCHKKKREREKLLLESYKKSSNQNSTHTTYIHYVTAGQQQR